MSDATPMPVELKKPLTLWEKVKAGVKGFIGTGLHYVPKGLLIGGVILGAVCLIGGPVGAFMHLSWETFLPRLGMTVLLGSLFTGAIGAYQGVKAGIEQRNAEIAAQSGELKRCRERDPEKTQELCNDVETTMVASHGLPAALSKGTVIGV